MWTTLDRVLLKYGDAYSRNTENISRAKLWWTHLPLCGCVWRTPARARGFSVKETGKWKLSRCPLSYIFNYVGQYDGSFTFFFFFFFHFFPSAFYLLSLLSGLAQRRQQNIGSFVYRFGVHNLATRWLAEPIRSFADERSKFIPAGMKFRGVTNSVALSERRWR